MANTNPWPRSRRRKPTQTDASLTARHEDAIGALPANTESSLLSVIVPVYNVAPYLEQTLSSILNQTYASLEVILIDDGSTDGSGGMCDTFAERDERIRVVHQANGGLSRARNRGMELAMGDFIAFADSDDLVPNTAYELLMAALTRSGSDFATGSVRRFDTNSSWDSWNQTHSHRLTAHGTNLAAHPDLIFDLVCWNKVFRREFVDRIELEFPVDRLYEDIVPMARAYSLAKSVDVVTKTVYEWRRRESGDSITQRRDEIDNMRHKFEEIDRAHTLVTATGDLEVNKRFYTKLFDGDLWVFALHISAADTEYRTVFEEFLRKYWDFVPNGSKASIQDKRRWFYVIAMKHGSAAAATHHDWVADNLHDLATVTRGRSVFLDVSQLPTDGPDLPRTARLLASSSKVVSHVNSMHWQGKKLTFTGWAYVPNLDQQDRQQISIVARHVDSGFTVPIDIVRHESPLAVQRAGSLRRTYGQSGFTASLNTDRLLDDKGKTSRRGSWTFDVTVKSGFVRRTDQFLSFDLKGSVRAMEPISAGKDLVIVPTVISRQPLGLKVRKPSVVATEIVIAGRHVRIQVRHKPGVRIAAAYLFHTHPRERVVGAHNSSSIGSTLEFTLPEPLTRQHIARSVRVETISGNRIHVAPPLDGSIPTRDPSSTLSAEITRTGWLSIHDEPKLVRIEAVEYLGDFRVKVVGSARTESAIEFSVHRTNSAGTMWETLPIRDNRFELVADLGYTDWYGIRRPLKPGTYTIALRDSSDARGGALRLQCEKALLSSFPRTIEDPSVHLKIEASAVANLFLKVEAPIPISDRGAFARRQLRREYGPDAVLQPENAVFLNCDIATSAHGNPLAIYDELVSRNSHLRIYWGVTDHSVPVPSQAVPVVKFSRQWYEKIATCRYLINNYGGIEGFAHRPYQRYLQTWHGTPYKYIGRSQIQLQHLGAQEKLVREAEGGHWDLLLSLSPYYSALVPRELNFSGQVLESGSPRNDVLVNATDETRAQLRERFGIAPDKKVLLYAPTFRDYLREGWEAAPFRGLDVEELSRFLGDEWVIVVRGHSFNARHGGSIGNGNGNGANIIDATQHLEINHLYLISDALLTDYSSAMFDYALTGQPILYFVPDHQQYIDSRGVYFDLAEVAPGPLCATEEELREAFLALPDYQSTYGAKYDAFREKFVPWDDGKASMRVVDEFFDNP